MGRQKRLQDLTIKDNFMFGAVMSIEENCIAFLEMVLGFPIEKSCGQQGEKHDLPPGI